MPEPDVLQRYLRNLLDALLFPDGRRKKVLKAGQQLRITAAVLKFEANTGRGRILEKQVPCLPGCSTAVPLRQALATGAGHPIMLHGHQLQRDQKTIHAVVPSEHPCCCDDHAWMQCVAAEPVYITAVVRSAKQLFVTFEGGGEQVIHRLMFAQNGQVRCMTACGCRLAAAGPSPAPSNSAKVKPLHTAHQLLTSCLSCTRSSWFASLARAPGT